jgi:hypothetical protein
VATEQDYSYSIWPQTIPNDDDDDEDDNNKNNNKGSTQL